MTPPARRTRHHPASGLPACLLLLAIALPRMLPAGEARPPRDRPDPIVTLGALAAEDYTEGIADGWIPLAATEAGVWFLNPRVSATDRDAWEYNLGSGYRHLILNRRGIVGANLFYDHRQTRNRAAFDQIGAGAEFLSRKLDFRFNAYLPLNGKTRVNDFETLDQTTARRKRQRLSMEWDDPYAGGHAILQPYRQWMIHETRATTTSTRRRFHQYEVAMRGWDAEAGVAVPFPAGNDRVRFKVFGGYYHYDGRLGLDDVNGFRARLEAHIRPGIAIDATYYDDTGLTGGHWTLGAYLAIPIGRSPEAIVSDSRPAVTRQADDISHRLNDRILRDPQIRTAVTTPREQPEFTAITRTTRTTTERRLIDQAEVALVDNVTFVHADHAGSATQDGTAENPYASIQQGVDAANSAVWVFDAANPYTENVVVPEAIELYGHGATLHGFDGRTWGNGPHPVVIAPDPGPTFTINGNAVTLVGFDIRHSGAGAIGSRLDPINQTVDITHAGIFGGNVSGLTINDHILSDNRLGHGIVLIADGTKPGGAPDLQADLLNNRINHVGGNALLVHGNSASGTFDIRVSGHYSESAANGISIRAQGYQRAAGDLINIAANNNSGFGIDAFLVATDNARLSIRDTVTDGNDHGINGMAVATGVDGEAHVDMRNVQANHNESWGIYYAYAISADPHGGPTVVSLENVTANHNRYGMDIISQSAGSDAIVELRHLTANYNDYGLFIDGDAHRQHAETRILGQSITANENAYDGIFGVWAYATDGPVYINLRDVVASHNGGDGIRLLHAEATGPTGHAALDLNDIIANNNGGHGLGNLHAYADGSWATVRLQHVAARMNHAFGVNAIIAEAGGLNADATISIRHADLTGNTDGAIQTLSATAHHGGQTHIDQVDVKE